MSIRCATSFRGRRKLRITITTGLEGRHKRALDCDSADLWQVQLPIQADALEALEGVFRPPLICDQILNYRSRVAGAE